MEERPKPGTIGWMDLTVADAGSVRDFYEAVAGWTSSAVDMGGYEDYGMNAPGTGQTVAGICHARGCNAGQPAQWLMYIHVPDLDASLEACRAKGGEVLGEPRTMPGYGRFCVFRDPSGAAAALFQAE